MARKKYDQDWVDKQLMDLDEPMPHVKARVPLICRTNTTNRSELPDGTVPGLYLLPFKTRQSGGARIEVAFGNENEGHNYYGGGALLGTEDARALAGLWDTVTSPHRSTCCSIRDEEVVDGVLIPDTFLELVDAWYTALGRSLDSAIVQTEEKRSMLREVRAALTGRAG